MVSKMILDDCWVKIVKREPAVRWRKVDFSLRHILHDKEKIKDFETFEGVIEHITKLFPWEPQWEIIGVWPSRPDKISISIIVQSKEFEPLDECKPIPEYILSVEYVKDKAKLFWRPVDAK